MPRALIRDWHFWLFRIAAFELARCLSDREAPIDRPTAPATWTSGLLDIGPERRLFETALCHHLGGLVQSCALALITMQYLPSARDF
jgi:hypothetical protein